MKKVLSLFLVLIVALCCSACGTTDVELEGDTEFTQYEAENVAIELWTFPIGNWGDRSIVSSIIAEFNKKYPLVEVNVTFLDYDTGDQVIADAIKNGNLPDIVFEGPERLIADYAVNGRLVDISDIWNDTYVQSIYENVRNVCMLENHYYMMPLCTQAHTMVINKDMFEACGALELIDMDTRTWTANDFFLALEMLQNYGIEKPCIIYCANQSGDQGTRMLVTNLCGGTFTNAEHTTYMVNSIENTEALRKLQECSAVCFDSTLTATDAINAFCDEETAMLFCWNAAVSMTHEIANQRINFSTLPMNFPTKDNLTLPVLDGGVWGFCIFDKQDAARIEACKCFIKEITGDTSTHEKAVIASGNYPVIDCKDVYTNDSHMAEYSGFVSNIGDFYQITNNWAKAREAWWNLLQEVGMGTEPTEALEHFDAFLSSD